VDLTAERALRTAFMKWLFDVTGGSTNRLAEAEDFSVPEGWTGELPSEYDIADAVRYLEGEYLIKAHWDMGVLPSVSLRHEGIREMEEALAAPKRQTEHFVPLVNITTIQGSVIGSQIQQGSPGARQTGTFNIDQLENVEAFLAAARKILANETLTPEIKARAEGDLVAMDRELASGEPRWPILRAFGTSVRDYLVEAAGVAAAAGLLQIIWP
jgi:hypothetical protein